jgi:hypothetical protein
VFRVSLAGAKKNKRESASGIYQKRNGYIDAFPLLCLGVVSTILDLKSFSLFTDMGWRGVSPRSASFSSQKSRASDGLFRNF